MNISELLDPSAITTELNAKKKDDVLSEMVDLLVSSKKVKGDVSKDIIERLMDREDLGSTGIGKGVAIPHAKCSGVKKMLAAMGISRKGIDFRSLDGESTYILFLLIAPSETPGPHLKALARISRLLDDKFVRDRLRAAENAEEVFEVIKEEEEKKVQ